MFQGLDDGDNQTQNRLFNITLDESGSLTRNSSRQLASILTKYTASGELLVPSHSLALVGLPLKKHNECASQLALSENLYEVKTVKFDESLTLMYINGLTDTQSLQTTFISTGDGCRVIEKLSWRLSAGFFTKVKYVNQIS